MSKNNKLKSYTINMHVVIDTMVDIKAESLEDAIAKAKTLEMRDVVSFEGDYCDGSVAVKGLWEN